MSDVGSKLAISLSIPASLNEVGQNLCLILVMNYFMDSFV